MSFESVILSNHLIPCCPFSFYLQSFPVSGSFPMSWIFASGCQNTGASTSVLPMHIQGWFPLGLTGLVSLQFKGLSRLFFSTTIQKHQFFNTSSVCACHFLIYSASVRSLLFLSFIVTILAWNVPLTAPIFLTLQESVKKKLSCLSHSIVILYFFALFT